MLKVTGNAALGLCIFLGLASASFRGQGWSALAYVLAIFVGVPVIYLTCISNAAISKTGETLVVLSLIAIITGIFFLW